MRWPVAIVLLIAAATSFAQSTTCTEGATTPDALYHADFASNKPFVEVRLNGSRPLHFILDTGSPLAGIDSAMVDELGFRSGRIISRSGGAGQKGGLVTELEPKACEEMGGARLANGTVMSLDFSQISRAEGVRVDGILGGDFYMKYVVVVDYQRQNVQVLDPSFEYNGSGYVLPVDIDGNHMFVSASLRKASGEYVEGKFMVDTGVRVALLLNAPFARTTSILDGQVTVPNITSGIGAGGETRGTLFKLAALRWGSLDRNDVIAFASTDTGGVLTDPGFAGIIGADLLRRYKLILDYPHSRIILEKTSATDTPFGYDASGMFLIGDEPRFKQVKVLRVLQKSPADDGGVRDGDLLVSVEGKDAVQLGLGKIREMFQTDSRSYSLKLRRNGRTIAVVLKTHDLLTSKAAVAPGVASAVR